MYSNTGDFMVSSTTTNYMDNDVSDLLRDNFGIFPENQNMIVNNDLGDKDLDQNLSDILEDLQNAVKEEDITLSNNNTIEEKSIKPSNKIHAEIARRQKAADDPIKKLLEL